MLNALIYLRLTSFVNWGWRRLKGLRQPKQLVGLLAFAGYIWFFFFRHWSDAPPARSSRRLGAEEMLGVTDAVSAALPAHWLPAALAFGAVALLVFVALMWIVPTQRAALGFSEAEIAFLFPAPVTRRALVHFRLLSGQFRSLVGATVMMLISNRWSFLGGNPLTHALGWWFVFSALNLHYSGANFTLTRLSDAGLGAIWRRLLALLLLAGTIAPTFWRLPPATRFPAWDDAAALRPLTDWIIAFTTTAPVSWVLWPFKLILGPFLAADARAFYLALGPAILVIGAHYFWVVKAAVAFEDAAIDYAEKRSARLTAWRSEGRFGGVPALARRAPFRLAGTGRAEVAFLWKNLLSTWPYFNLRSLFVAAGIITAAGSWMMTQAAWRGFLPAIGGGAAMFGVYLLIIGPQFARQDIRSDLPHADMLKTYPLPGWQIVLGELLTPVFILTGLLWLALLTAAIALQPGQLRADWLTPPLRVTVAAWLAVLTPALVTLQLLVPNAAALVFPAWFQSSRARGGGPEVAGQRMLFFFAQLLTMVLALLPAAAFAALLIFILQPFIGPAWAVNAGGIAVLTIIAAEVWCGVWLLGERFDKYDLSGDQRT